jgi:hypothetical protein
MTVRASALPTESCLAIGYAGADLADAYLIMLPPGATRDINGLAEEILAHPSAWFRALLSLRDGIVAPFGIKTARSLLEDEAPEKIYFFPVVRRTSTEVVVGEVDVHLDFQASILLGKPLPDGRQELTLTTVVHCHNRLGRIYLFLIRPFHGVVVRDFLRRAEWRLQRSAPRSNWLRSSIPCGSRVRTRIFICDRNSRTAAGARSTSIAAENRGCRGLLTASGSVLAWVRQICCGRE